MTGILIVAHGSRQKSTEQILRDIAARVGEILSGNRIRVAFMEFGEPSISEGLRLLAAEGGDDIAVVPYFLFDGVHIREDKLDSDASFDLKPVIASSGLGKLDRKSVV